MLNAIVYGIFSVVVFTCNALMAFAAHRKVSDEKMPSFYISHVVQGVFNLILGFVLCFFVFI